MKLKSNYRLRPTKRHSCGGLLPNAENHTINDQTKQSCTKTFVTGTVNVTLSKMFVNERNFNSFWIMWGGFVHNVCKMSAKGRETLHQGYTHPVPEGRCPASTHPIQINTLDSDQHTRFRATHPIQINTFDSDQHTRFRSTQPFQINAPD